MNFFISAHTYSFPLSDLSIFSFFPVCLSTNAVNSLNLHTSSSSNGATTLGGFWPALEPSQQYKFL
jgi:hypothetical protein